MRVLGGIDETKPYVFKEFPKMLYHPDYPEREPVIVENFEEEKALGSDWYQTPLAAGEAKQKLIQQMTQPQVASPAQTPQTAQPAPSQQPAASSTSAPVAQQRPLTPEHKK